MRWLELKIPPLALWLLFALASILCGTLWPGANLPFAGQQDVAIAAVLAGAALAVKGVLAFRRAKTTVNPLVPGKASAIVASGIYGISRNPMYLGMAVALFGVAAWHATLPGFGLVPLFGLYMTVFQIKPEERALLAIFGEDFAAYMRRVRRWI